jgi:hypothetical protein
VYTVTRMRPAVIRSGVLIQEASIDTHTFDTPEWVTWWLSRFFSAVSDFFGDVTTVQSPDGSVESRQEWLARRSVEKDLYRIPFCGTYPTPPI